MKEHEILTLYEELLEGVTSFSQKDFHDTSSKEYLEYKDQLTTLWTWADEIDERLEVLVIKDWLSMKPIAFMALRTLLESFSETIRIRVNKELSRRGLGTFYENMPETQNLHPKDQELFICASHFILKVMSISGFFEDLLLRYDKTMNFVETMGYKTSNSFALPQTRQKILLLHKLGILKHLESNFALNPNNIAHIVSDLLEVKYDSLKKEIYKCFDKEDQNPFPNSEAHVQQFLNKYL